MDNKNAKYYIWGLLSGILFIPVIEEFLNVVMAWIQVLLLKPNKIVLKGNQEIADLQESDEYTVTNCIGFQAPSKEDYFEDEDDF